jgi:hypothetical protein
MPGFFYARLILLLFKNELLAQVFIGLQPYLMKFSGYFERFERVILSATVRNLVRTHTVTQFGTAHQ